MTMLATALLLFELAGLTGVGLSVSWLNGVFLLTHIVMQNGAHLELCQPLYINVMSVCSNTIARLHSKVVCECC